MRKVVISYQSSVIRLVFGFLICLILNTLYLIPNTAYATDQFASSYNVTYDVSDSGETQVTEVITLKNLTDKLYASTFTLTIGATQISDISATDGQGPMNVTSTNVGKRTQIAAKFNQQVVGKNKEYVWTLKFKSRDFAQKQGKIWQVSIPKVAPEENLEVFVLNLLVPVSFGDPATVIPEPKSQKESAGKLQFTFDKNQLLESGILANFGVEQNFKFNVSFNITNNGLLPTLVKLPIPPDTNYQQIIINEITPRPENVTMDNDGNFIGQFKIDRKQTINVNIKGLSKSFVSPILSESFLTDKEYARYTANQSYWEKDNPQIKAKLAEIFNGKNPTSNKEKAKLIYNYVVLALKYDPQRLVDKKYDRLGALTATTNSSSALSSEFTDLFITLSRAANVPARMLIGYAYSGNKDLRPLSFAKGNLHSWAEYYDPSLGWIMVDPTWGNTSGGVDYFSKFDLNHLSLAIRGTSSEEPISPDNAEIQFSEDEFKPNPSISVKIEAPSEIFSGFPSEAKVIFENIGNAKSAPSQYTLSAASLILSDNKNATSNQINLPPIPPFGKLEYVYELKTENLWDSYSDTIQVYNNQSKTERGVTVKPFFEYRFFSAGIALLVTFMVAVYLAILGLHLRQYSNGR